MPGILIDMGCVLCLYYEGFPAYGQRRGDTYSVYDRIDRSDRMCDSNVCGFVCDGIGSAEAE